MISLPSVYATITDLKVAVRLQALAGEIKGAERQMVSAIITIADGLTEARALIPPGTYIQWIRSETNISEDTAQRFIRAAEIYRLNDPELNQLGSTAAAMLAGLPTAQEVIIDLTRHQQRPPSNRMVKIIAYAHKQAAQIADHFEVADNRTVAVLGKLLTKGYSDTIEEIVRSGGWIQNTGEHPVHLTAAPATIEAAIVERAQLHRLTAGEAKAASRLSLFIRAVESPENGSIYAVCGFESEEDAANALKRLTYGNGSQNGKYSTNENGA
jgi:hypothetical protein